MTSAALAEDGEDIVLRGVIDPDTFDALRVDVYQREIESQRYIEDIARAYATRSVADIDLGMRGGDYDEKDGTFTLHAPVYIIDGFQRVTAARLALQHGLRPVLGAALRFNTTFAWEKERFHVLNARRKRVSPNVHLRNLRTDYSALDMLHELTKREHGFPLYERVCWQQNLRREHLMSAMTLLRCAGAVQAHFGAARSTGLERLVSGVQGVAERIGEAAFRTNVVTFFGVIEQCFGLSRIIYRERATVVRTGFLMALARLLDEHDAFWNGTRLIVPAAMRRKLASFPVTDPNVQVLASSSGTSSVLLYEMLLAHMNSGRRSGRLIARIDGVPGKERVAC